MEQRLCIWFIQRWKAAEELGFEYVSFDELCEKSDIISLHCPLTPETEHIINKKSLDKMKEGVIIITVVEVD